MDGINILNIMSNYIIIIFYFNILLILIVLIISFKNSLYNLRFNRNYNNLYIKTLAYIFDESKKSFLRKELNDTFKKSIVRKILIEYSKNNNIDLSTKFINLELNKDFDISKNNFNNEFIRKITNWYFIIFKKRKRLESIYNLGLMRNPEILNELYNGILSKDFEERYISFFLLSHYNLQSQNKLGFFIENLLNSNINEKKIIELIENLKIDFKNIVDILDCIRVYNLSFDDNLKYDLKAKTFEEFIEKRTLILNVIKNYDELLIEDNSDKTINIIYNFGNESINKINDNIFIQNKDFIDLKDEVRIKYISVVIEILGKTRNNKYFYLINTIYSSDISTRILVKIAENIIFFPENNVFNTIKNNLIDNDLKSEKLIYETLILYPNDYTIKILEELTYNKDWEVRFSAVNSLTKIGEKGMKSLIKLTLDLNNKYVSDISYFILNSNVNIYNSVKKTGDKDDYSLY